MRDQSSSPAVPADRVDADLARIAEVATELGVNSLVREVDAERHRLADARFFVACIGQFKRGKSTLLNALVGCPILPVGVVPVTSVVTILREGNRPEALVRSASGSTQSIGVDCVADMVDERLNPENAKGVAAVEVFLPSAILRNGLCLVDTPGIGSVFAGNTETTRTFLPHIDVALLVVGPDFPVSGDELEITERVSRDGGHVLVALNKADQAAEQQRREVLTFSTQVVERRTGRRVDGVFEISALERTREDRPTRDWSRLERTLSDFAQTKRTALVAKGVDRARRRFVQRLLAEVEEQEGALKRPIEETAARTGRLRRAAMDVDRSLRDLRFLFDVVEIELASGFDQQRTNFVRRSTSELQTVLRQWIRQNVRLRGGRLRRGAFDQAGQLARQSVTNWLTELEPAVVAQYEKAIDRFVHIGNEYIARVTADAGTAVGRLEIADIGSYDRPHFYFANLMHLTAGNPWTWALDHVGSRAASERSIVTRSSEYLAHLVESNSHRVENDFRERTANSRRELERTIRARLNEALASAERALTLATEAQRMATDQVSDRLARLSTIRAEMRHFAGVPAA